MHFVPIEKKTLLDFVYGSIEIYTNDLVNYGEFGNYELARKEAKREVLELLPFLEKKENHFIYSLSHQGQTVGNLWYIINHVATSQPQSFLTYLFIEPDYRNKGFATLAMQCYEHEIIHQHHCIESCFYVFCANHPAVSLYKRCGYSIVDKAPFNEASTPSRYKMAKQL